MNTLVAMALLAGAALPGQAQVELVTPVEKIWDQGPHNAFTDLLRFEGRWLCVLREGTGHAAGAGAIRVLASTDGKRWQSAALIEDKNVDLRDPHICLTPEGKLMLVGGAAVPPQRNPLTDHYSFACFSREGTDWTRPQRISESWHWLWRVTWHKGTAYGVAYQWQKKDDGKYQAALFQSKDGQKFDKLTDFAVPQATEATLRFDANDMLCLQRRDGKPNTAMLGRSQAPYKDWTWKDLGIYYGGPDFVRGPDGRWWAAGRIIKDKAQTVLCLLDVKEGKLDPVLTLPSGGDTSYPGLAWNGDELWISYYSSHEGKSSIYLAKVRLKK